MSQSHINPPKYIIDLDLPPEKRWVKIITDYKDKCIESFKQIEKMVIGDGALMNMVYWASRKIIGYYSDYAMYKKELESIGNILGLPLDKMIIGQLCYELFSACTSVVFRRNGINVHYRTMDWEFPALKDLTVHLDFVSGGRKVYSAITWVSYIGVLTGMNDNFSLSVNYRISDAQSIWSNISELYNLSYPVGYLCREVLEENQSYDYSLNKLKKTNLIAPVYLTLCENKDRAHVIVRDRKSVELVNELAIDKKYIVQCNRDPEGCNTKRTDVMFSQEREKLVEQVFEFYDKANIKTIVDSLSHYPIVNDITIYLSVMIPSENKMSTILY